MRLHPFMVGFATVLLSCTVACNLSTSSDSSHIAKTKNTDSLWGYWNNERLSDSLRLEALIRMAEAMRERSLDSMETLALEALKYAQKKNRPASECRALNVLSYWAYNRSKPDEAMTYADEALAVAEKHKLTAGLMIAYKRKGLAYSMVRDAVNARVYFEKGRDLANEVDSLQLLSHFLSNIGTLEEQAGNYDAALGCHKEALRIAVEFKDVQGQSIAMSNAANVHLSKREFLEAIDLFKQALKLSQGGGYLSLAAVSLNNMALAYAALSMQPENAACLQQAADIFIQLGDSASLASVYHGLGTSSIKQGNYPQAIDYYQRTLQIQQNLKDTIDMVSAYYALGNVNLHMDKLAKAEIEYSKGLALAEAVNDLRSMYGGWFAFGTLYGKMKNPDKGIPYLEKCLKLASGSNSKSEAEVLFNLGSMLDIKKEHAEALVHFRRAKELFEMLGLQEQLAGAYAAIGGSLGETGKFNQSVEHCLQGLEVARRIKSTQHVIWNCGCLHVAYKQAGNPAKGLEYHEAKMAAKDSLLNEENAAKIARLEMNFEFSRKQDSLELQSQKELYAANSETQQQRNQRNLSIAGVLLLLVTIGGLGNRFWIVRKKRAVIEAEKKRSDELLLNILPSETAEELKRTGTAKTRHFDEVTVLFADIQNFVGFSSHMEPEALVEELDYCFKAFDGILTRYDIEKIKTVGDAYICASGLPTINDHSAHEAAKMALDMQAFMLQYKSQRESQGRPYFEIRIGLHTGPVVAGIVGIKKFAYDIWGDTVNIASRMQSNSEVGAINISEATYLKVKSMFATTFRGQVEVKGKGKMNMYYLNQN